jgi:hypothetical protein
VVENLGFVTEGKNNFEENKKKHGSIPVLQIELCEQQQKPGRRCRYSDRLQHCYFRKVNFG